MSLTHVVERAERFTPKRDVVARRPDGKVTRTTYGACAERARKLGATTIHSIGEIATYQRLKDSNAQNLSPKAMLSELFADHRQLTAYFRSAHEVCERHDDVATTSLIEVWIDETERRSWFLGEIVDSLD